MYIEMTWHVPNVWLVQQEPILIQSTYIHVSAEQHKLGKLFLFIVPVLLHNVHNGNTGTTYNVNNVLLTAWLHGIRKVVKIKPVQALRRSFQLMVVATHVFIMTFQIFLEPNVLLETSSFNKKRLQIVMRLFASEKEKSTVTTRASVSNACNIRELKRTTQNVYPTHVPLTKSSHGLEPVLTAQMEHHLMKTRVLALLMIRKLRMKMEMAEDD